MSPITQEQRDEIIRLLFEGLSSDDISEKLGLPPRTVRAIKAHITMGTYKPEDVAEIEDAIETTFGLERDLQNALRSNIQQLEEGLKIIDEGKERIVPAGRIDISAKDKQGTIVVIELKAGEAGPDSIAQVLAYMSSTQEIEKKPVRGMLVAGGFHDRVKFAARAVPNLELKQYSFKFSFDTVK